VRVRTAFARTKTNFQSTSSEKNLEREPMVLSSKQRTKTQGKLLQ
jgi:hypothetical protein